MKKTQSALHNWRKMGWTNPDGKSMEEWEAENFGAQSTGTDDTSTVEILEPEAVVEEIPVATAPAVDASAARMDSLEAMMGQMAKSLELLAKRGPPPTVHPAGVLSEPFSTHKSFPLKETAVSADKDPEDSTEQ